MAATVPAKTSAVSKRRWYAPTLNKYLIAVLAMQGVFLCSTHYAWFSFIERKGHAVLITVAATTISLSLVVVWLLIARLFASKAQFRLTTLMLIVFAVAISCGWLAREMDLARRQRTILNNRRFSPTFNPNSPDLEAVVLRLRALKVGNSGGQQNINTSTMYERAFYRLEPILGSDFFHEVVGLKVNDATVADFETISKNFQIKDLTLNSAKINDEDIVLLYKMPQLETLSLSFAPISDKGLVRLKKLKRLRSLNLEGTRITDAGLVDLKELPELRVLEVNVTKVSDVGLEHLRELTRLERINLNRTEVTDSGVRELQAILKDTYILRFR